MPIERVALVTGASRGIGRAIAVRLARAGLAVGVNYLSNDAAAAQTVDLVRREGAPAVALRADVADPGAVDRMVADLLHRLGPPTVVVCSAGVYRRRSFEDLTVEEWDRTLAVNLGGAFHVVRACLPHLLAAGWGRIVFISSQLAFLGSSHGADYAASKAGLLGLARSLARELSPRGITANVVAPGPVETDMIASDTPDLRARRVSTIPVRRVGRPEEVAEAVAYLVGPGSGYVTGATVHVNGGDPMV